MHFRFYLTKNPHHDSAMRTERMILLFSETDHVPAQGRQHHVQMTAVQLPTLSSVRGHIVRVFFRIDSFHVVMVQHDMLQHLQLAKRTKIGLQRDVLLQIAVHGEDRNGTVVGHGGGSVYQRNVRIVAAIIQRAMKNGAKRPALLKRTAWISFP